jgi:hypothetical protein
MTHKQWNTEVEWAESHLRGEGGKPTRWPRCLIPIRYDIIWYMIRYDIWYDYMIYLLTSIGLTHGGSSTVHIYTRTIHRTTQSTQTIHRATQSTQTIHRTTQLIHRTTQPLRTMRPIFKAGIPIASRCYILHIFFNKYKYWVF